MISLNNCLFIFAIITFDNCHASSTHDNGEEMPIEAHDWFENLIINLMGYSIVLIPAALCVITVKRNLCLDFVRNNYFIKLFVYGSDDQNDYHGSHHYYDDQKLPLTVNDTKESSTISSLPLSLPRFRRASLLIWCFMGLQISYLTWGVLQEKIMTTEYAINSYAFDNNLMIGNGIIAITNIRKLNGIAAPNNEHAIDLGHNDESRDSLFDGTYHIKFRNSQFLVLVNRILAFVFAIIAIFIINKRKSHTAHSNRNTHGSAPYYEYIFCSLSNVLSSWCQYEALKFVSFPTQVLSKACKLLPVMLMSQLVEGKKYRIIEYIFAISISIGMTMFLWSDRLISTKHNEISGYKYSGGLIILILYLTFDSFTSNWQGKLFDKYKVSMWHMMGAVNFYSILLTVTSLTQQGDLGPAFRLVLSNVNLFRDCLLLSLCSASGQLFVFYTIATFGPIVFVTIMTLRQAIAILLSCIIYDHILSPIGLIGIVLVFVTLFIQIYWKSNRSKR